MKGNNDNKHQVMLLVTTLITSLMFSPVLAKEIAANVQSIVGEVTATSPGEEKRRLRTGDRIYSGDTVNSGPNGSAQLIYIDLSRMAVRVDTVFTIEEYQYNTRDETKSRSIISLIKGALRSVTGLIGKLRKENVTIKTPVATIGIRGTDHEVVHISSDYDGVNPIAELGTYDKVYDGATYMKTADGMINLSIDEVGFVSGVPGNIETPVRIKELPDNIEKLLIKKVPMQATLDLPTPISATAMTDIYHVNSTDKSSDGSNDRSPDRSIDRSNDRSNDRSPDRSDNKSTGNSSSKSTDR